MKALQKHPCLQEADLLKVICRPLEIYDINYFAHVQIKENGQFSGINNNPRLFEHYINQEYYNVDVHMKSDDDLENMIIWDNLVLCAQSEKMHREAAQFGVKHTFTIVEEHDGYKDFYHFATDLKNDAINLTYLSHLDNLKLFIKYFMDKVLSIKSLREMYQHNFTVDKAAGAYHIQNSQGNVSGKTQAFLQSLMINDYIQHQGSIITARECQVLTWLFYGKTCDQIAEILGVTVSTVNKHIAKIKLKSNCINQFQMGAYLANLSGGNIKNLIKILDKNGE